MNAKIKTFMMALVIIPVALCFAACGGQLDSKASVNINGNYNETVTQEDLNSYLSASTTDMDSISSGYKLSFDMSTSNAIPSESGIINCVMIFKQTDTKQELSMKLNLRNGDNSQTMYASAYIVTENEQTVLYFDGDMQLDKQHIKGKYKFEGEMANQLSTFLEFYGQFANIFQPEMNSGLNIKEIKKATTDNSAKFKLTVNTIEDKTADVYYVFENNKFVGFQVNNYQDYMDSDNTLTISAAMCVFNDNIDFNTNGFGEYNPTV